MKTKSSKLKAGIAAMVAVAGLAGVLAAAPVEARDRDGGWDRRHEVPRHSYQHPQHRPYGQTWQHRHFVGPRYYAPSYYYGPPAVFQPAPVFDRYYDPLRGWIEIRFGGPL